MRIAFPKNHILYFILILLVSIPITTYAVDGQRKLTQPVPPATFPIVINQAGSYVLTSNLVVTDPNLNAIEITVNDVTLDLNGHKIQGPSTGSGNGNGIYALESYSITIKNGRIWGFGQYGVWLYSFGGPTEKGAGHIIENIQAMNNHWGGIYAAASLITDCIINNNGNPTGGGFGIHAFHSTISRCTANNNFGMGLNVEYSTVTQCTANYNGSSGIGCYYSIITNCTASNNSYDGIGGGQRSYIVENNLRDNGRYGLNLNDPNTYAFAVRNVASGNGSGNFYAMSGNYMPLTGDNANYGF